MIQPLVEALAGLLRGELAGEGGPARGVLALAPGRPPAPADLPLLAVVPGRLTVSQRQREGGAEEERPIAVEEQAAPRPDSIYPLRHLPLRGTLTCTLVDGRGQRTALAEGADFDVDTRLPALLLRRRIGERSRLELSYSAAALSAWRDVQHELWVDCYASDGAGAELGASLAAVAVLTGLDGLLAEANRAAERSAGPLSVRGSFERLVWLGGAPRVAEGDLPCYRLELRAEGRLRLARALEEAGSPIARIVSPGREPGGPPVDIDAGLR